MTPTIVHFGAVLALSAYLTVPHQSALSLCVGLGAAGVAGLSYVAVVAAGMCSVATHYVPVGEDWIWNTIGPALAYAGSRMRALR